MQLKEWACLQWNLGTSPGQGGESTGNQLSVDWQPKGLCLGCLLLYYIITCIGCSVNATCKLLFCCSVLQMWLLHVCQSWGRGNSPLWLFLRFLSSFLPLLKMFGCFFSQHGMFSLTQVEGLRTEDRGCCSLYRGSVAVILAYINKIHLMRFEISILGSRHNSSSCLPLYAI